MTDPERLFREPHRRRDPLRGEWVLVSPGRVNRPWQGGVERPDSEPPPAYDAECPLCPGNVRATGERNPPYDRTFVFANDFAALRADTSNMVWEGGDGLLRAEGEP